MMWFVYFVGGAVVFFLGIVTGIAIERMPREESELKDRGSYG